MCDILNFTNSTNLDFTFQNVDRDLCPPGDYVLPFELCLGQGSNKVCSTQNVPVRMVENCVSSTINLAQNPIPAFTRRELGQSTQNNAWRETDLVQSAIPEGCTLDVTLCEVINGVCQPINTAIFRDNRSPNGNSLDYLLTNDQRYVGTYNFRFRVCYQGDNVNCPETPVFTVEIVNPCTVPQNLFAPASLG